MPGWHAKTKKPAAEGRVQVVGLIQEQHPDRCRLFMQWQGMDWPVLSDPLNLLGVAVVPTTLFIDEHGIIRAIQPKPDDFQGFLESDYPEPKGGPAPAPPRMDISKPPTAEQIKKPDFLRTRGNALFLWGDPSRLGEAAQCYEQSLQLDPEWAAAYFRRGVAFRARYDSKFRQADDFNQAVTAWGQALDLDPNQYIWRRRIQQYGPRLDKPYPFYDWVPQARKEIEASGEIPFLLEVEPGAAEFANPTRRFETEKGKQEEPDPQGRILRDKDRLVKIECTVVPTRLAPGKAGRVHLVFRPDGVRKVHWTNDAGGLELWIDPPMGWQVDRQYLAVKPAAKEQSKETRTLEFEVKCPSDFTGIARLKAYALYYLCEGDGGTCLYLRQDLDVEIMVK